MLEHSSQTIQQSLTAQEAREHLLFEREASKQAIQELGDEELAEVVGGLSFSGAAKGFKMAAAYGGDVMAQVKSAAHGLRNSDASTWKYAMGQAAARPKK